ncbi:hypothetical protein [Streptomyces clavuligerus]|nr:hypothetical protein [Streptomyces clavuligerus]MBY6307717.1 hypothetical protein [Streptomyces clavuligerus]WDN56443.1 hypothetical protein LL058_31890 [Streptomyces clavuligerus]
MMDGQPPAKPPAPVHGSGSGSGVQHLDARHRTDITLGQYLMDMTNVALRAQHCADAAEKAEHRLGVIADAIGKLAPVFERGHALDRRLIEQFEQTGQRIEQAQRCARQASVDCQAAAEGARLAAMAVGRVYGEDQDAKEEAGLDHASAAVHHEGH